MKELAWRLRRLAALLAPWWPFSEAEESTFSRARKTSRMQAFQRPKSETGFLENAPRPLKIPTYDGSGQCVHPDVIAIHSRFYPFEHVMVVEPYPFGDESLENPSIVASDDGLGWAVPHGVTNPIVPAPAKNGAWNSDADVMNHRGEELVVYYRYNSGRGETTLLRTTSSDGLHWSVPTQVLRFSVSGRFASPGFVEREGRLAMFYVDTIDRTVLTAESSDGLRWSDARLLFPFPDAWHLDATVDGGFVYLLLNDGHSLFLLRSEDLHQWVIMHGNEEGDSGAWVPLEKGSGQPLLRPSSQGWDDGRIYRSTGLINGGAIRIWYSAQSKRGEWRVGHTEGIFPNRS
jgi:hypothetical protein